MLTKTPRHERSPGTEIDVLLSNLSAIYSELHPEAQANEFINTCFKELYECEHTCGDTLAETHLKATANERGQSIDGAGSFTKIAAITISCAYCCQAQRAFDAGQITTAWTYIIDAREWCSLVMQQTRRVTVVAELDKKKRISVKRSTIVRMAKNEKYSDKAVAFVIEKYHEQAWKNKAEAIATISALLAVYATENNLPVEKVKCPESGQSKPKESWERFVKNRLPSAEQVKIDAANFKKT